VNLADAQRLARRLMDAHGLADWRLELDHARRRAGACRHPRRTISLSAQLIPLYPEEAVRGVVLHEIAHARVGASHGHDAVWKREARRLGAPDAARLPGSLPAPAAPWVGTCPRCGAQRRLFAAPRRVVACGACARDFRPDLVLTWTHEGVPARPGGAYARELARLVRVGRP
jgi:predicted SprT family Zn-dependent metalloprotease